MIEGIADYKGNKIVYFKSEVAEGKKNIVLLHGYSFESSVWDKISLPNALNKIGYNVYAIDEPEFPKSRNKQISTDLFFDFLKNFITQLGGSCLLGSSAGGYLAAKFSEENASLVKCLILVGAGNLNEIRSLSGIKLLGVWGSLDNTFSPESASKEIERLGGKFVIINGARHACYLDRPDDFNKIVVNFLEKL
ncbi:MAG: alpha/beta hydrolase [Candidatus Micrarchaeota archaeon]